MEFEYIFLGFLNANPSLLYYEGSGSEHNLMFSEKQFQFERQLNHGPNYVKAHTKRTQNNKNDSLCYHCNEGQGSIILALWY